MNSSKNKLPELLAPAGSMEAFHAAMEGGADAIYLGVGELNARLRAKNFTIQTLSYLVNYAQQKNVKIYITLNTIVKQTEIPPILDLLYQLDQLKVDAVIVQDLGLAYLIRNHFPNLNFHASTQMVIHNQVGVEAAKKLGFSRVILSRETTMEEIQNIQAKTAVELEVFIHGALCYSVSGLCLASSYLGGWSGNRGRCTQVCRRKFSSKDGQGFYFSPKDFSAADYIQSFSEIGITSLKIEGRMKSAEYVYSVVKSYRTIIDDFQTLDRVKPNLENDLGREKTPFLLDSVHQDQIIVSHRPSGTGIPLGKVSFVKGDKIILESAIEIAAGDKIRIHNQQGAEGVSVTVEDIHSVGNQKELQLKKDHSAKAGDQVFFISRKSAKNKNWSLNKFDVKPTPFQKRYGKTNSILKKLRNSLSSKETTPTALFYKVNQIEWLNSLKNIETDFLIFSGGKSELYQLAQSRKQIQFWKSKLVIELPPFIGNGELDDFRSLISKFSDMGVHFWMASHFSHRELFPKDDRIFSASPVWTANQATQKQLIDMGYAAFCYSIEDDILNLKAIPHDFGILPVFGYIPLFISRVTPGYTAGDLLSDNKNYHFLLKEKDGLYYLLGERPLCLFHRQTKMEGLGIGNYLIDLSFFHPSRKLLKAVSYHFKNQEKMPDTILFNHKAGFK